MRINYLSKGDEVTAESLFEKIRPVQEGDKRRFPTFSYSKLDTYLNCPLQYKFKYIDKCFSRKPTLATSLGTTLHRALELKGLAVKDHDKLTKEEQDEINHVVYEGDSKERVIGVNELKKMYFEDWYAPDNASGMNYEEKLDLFMSKVLPSQMEYEPDGEWIIVGTEIPFDFVYDDKAIFHGFIDRVDEIDEKLRIIDYKTSKKVFPDSKIKTPLQHIIYDLGCICLYNQIPAYHEYNFILLNEKQTADDGCCSKGYLTRGVKKIDSTLDEILNLEQSNDNFVPKPSPLCYWCPFHSDSPNADSHYIGMCEYHSLWTPNNKTFEVLNPYGSNDKIIYDKPTNKTKKVTNRKLIF